MPTEFLLTVHSKVLRSRNTVLVLLGSAEGHFTDSSEHVPASSSQLSGLRHAHHLHP
jgi:hypothetical protein